MAFYSSRWSLKHPGTISITLFQVIIIFPYTLFSTTVVKVNTHFGSSLHFLSVADSRFTGKFDSLGNACFLRPREDKHLAKQSNKLL